MKAKDENLKKLVEKLMKAKHAQVFLEDIEAGDRILRNNPAPRPDDMLLANIKANMALHKMPQRIVTFRTRLIEALAVAASIAIIATISLKSIRQTPPNDPGPIQQAALLPPGWWTLEDKGYVDTINKYEDINQKVEQQLYTDSDNADAFGIEEFRNQIEHVKENLVNIETGQDTYSSPDNIDNTYINPGSIVEDWKNRLNEQNNFWEDDYSNAGAIEL